MDRRRLLVTLAGIISWALPRRVLGSRVALPLAKLKLKEPGDSITLKLKGEVVTLVNHEDGIRAFSPICTHKKCKVRWRKEQGNFRCKCHKSFYDAHGKNFGGPAPKPLKRFPAAERDGRLLVILE